MALTKKLSVCFIALRPTRAGNHYKLCLYTIDPLYTITCFVGGVDVDMRWW